MFTDLWTARRSALSLARTLMVATVVIAIGVQFAVITADDIDGSETIINDYDPFGERSGSFTGFARPPVAGLRRVRSIGI